MEEKFLFLDGKLVSNDIFKEQFACELSACNGACCWKGDYGAPVSRKEAECLIELTPSVMELLTEDSKKTLQSQDSIIYYNDIKQLGTSLNADGSCVFMTWEGGMANCVIENEKRKNPDLPDKPVSCQLYPIRVRNNAQNDLDILEYDRWDICNAACAKGKKENMPIFRFVRNGVERKYGKDFYNLLEEIYSDLSKTP